MGCATSQPTAAGDNAPHARAPPPTREPNLTSVAPATREPNLTSVAPAPASVPDVQLLPSPDAPAGRSRLSLQMGETLDTLELEMREMEATCSAAAAEIGGLDADAPLPTGLRSELAKLHGLANKLLATRIDAILTGGLTSYRDQARARRKALVLAAESLIEQLEAQIRLLDAHRDAHSVAPARAPGKPADSSTLLERARAARAELS